MLFDVGIDSFFGYVSGKGNKVKINKWEYIKLPLDNYITYSNVYLWIRKLWYIYTMEYYSAIKKNTFESVLMR